MNGEVDYASLEHMKETLREKDIQIDGMLRVGLQQEEEIERLNKKIAEYQMLVAMLHG
jgi:hypothetical protein